MPDEVPKSSKLIRSIVVLAFAVGASQLAVPAHADAQILKKIRDQVNQKVESAKARADSAAVARAGRTMDSTLARTGRAVDTAVSKTAGVADAVVDKTGAIVSSAAGALRPTDDEEKLAAELAAGRVVLEVQFAGATEQIADASKPLLERLARLLKEQSATFRRKRRRESVALRKTLGGREGSARLRRRAGRATLRDGIGRHATADRPER